MRFIAMRKSSWKLGKGVRVQKHTANKALHRTLDSAGERERYASRMENHMKELVSKHYDEKYFDWQSSMGEFGGWANQTMFIDFVGANSDILDFGCGGGFLLGGLRCHKKVGVEINPSAAEIARSKGIEVFDSAAKVPDDYVDTII
jgi:SAM-dependent methyltransferase